MKRANKINFIAYAFFAISAFFVVFLSLEIKDITILYTWFLGATVFFFLKRKDEKHLFIISFSVNTIASILFCLDNYYNTGYLNSTNLDDNEFYYTTIKLINSDIGDYFKIHRLSIFYIFTTKIYQILEFFGFDSKSYFHYLIYNIVLGALVPLLVLSLSKSVYHNQLKKIKAAYLVAFFPTLIYFSAVGLRDSWITFFFTLFVVVYIKKTMNFYKKWFVIFFALGIIYILRHQSIFYPLIFAFIYELFKIKNIKKKTYLFFSGILILLVCYCCYFETIQEYYLWYKNYTIGANTNNSLGVKLKYEFGLLGKFIYFLAYILGPIPPLFVYKGITLPNVFLGIGTILGYFILPSYFFAFYKGNKDPLRVAILISFLSVSFIISLITGHLRHKTLFYPIILALTFLDLSDINWKLKWKFFSKLSLAYLVIGLIYFSIKLEWI
ncbi:hypothetical protein [Aestuariivivens sediminis]|uniref:hypothetical protein n=1 Tax=Aestuariivivens sediminis TaxID=2913557 RepID=UPI001F55B474|nr:hypothetical protein [Aestuariivivens sediminis]